MSQASEAKLGANMKSGMRTGVLQRELKLWERIDWPNCIQAGIFKDWACRLRNKSALEYFNRSISICQTKGEHACCNNRILEVGQQKCHSVDANYCKMASRVLEKRSSFRRSIGQPELALEDAQKAHDLLALEGKSKLSNILNKCDAILECNEFEDNLVQLNIEKCKYKGKIANDRFKLRANHATSVLEDSLGDALHPFLLNNWPLIMEVARSRRTSVAFTAQPLWQLSENVECDVESQIAKEKTVYSPLDRARYRMSQNVYNNHYLHRSSADVNMLQQLKSNINFSHLLSHNSMPYLTELLTDQYAIVQKFMMCHSRSPLYYCRHMKCRGTQICERSQTTALFRIEYQTRRDCFRMLREVHKRRQERNIERLTDYIEQIMSTNILLRTNRTLPWKWEFVNEVYNILALAHIDKCAAPKNVDFLDLNNQSALYLLAAERAKDLSVKFGGHNVYAEIDKEKERQSRVAKKLEQLYSRLKHSRFAIERTYLQFEIARTHFKESRYNKALILAQKALIDARNCNSNAWRFNITFLICQVHAKFNRFKRLADSLNKAIQLAVRLQSPKLKAYLALCHAVNQYELDFENRRQWESSFKGRKRKGHSVSSMDSTDNNMD
ncbi:uncharacterized protein LOC111596540 isoform X2 [Drosophila hydei]|uniref:Uncharacterized protein LOC111596540 isoform X2 n=1 Tax=Drosophila hydei TaxID=7224 RepID=A0A6J1LJB0_DROHY|nr:uncharacterized protein LOC111596540 isoform X2 [Drosophila hydei]